MARGVVRRRAVLVRRVSSSWLSQHHGPAGGADRISALPNKVLQIVLSSLPSDDAVRTSVLARR
ncbi:hypothetical protein EJB05_37013, partial [Eragrostis curvula]